MIELFETLSSYIDKITQFFHVIYERILDAWATFNIYSSFFPVKIAGLIIVVVVIVIIFRILGR